MKKSNPGFYYLAVNLLETSKQMSHVSIPQNIPVVDLVDEISLFDDKEKAEYWKECHKQFVHTHPKSIGITAYGCGHYIMVENPGLVIATIAKSYAETVDETQKVGIYKRALNYSILSSSKLVKSNHSENNLNSWGYDLLGQGNTVSALEIFRFNVALNPLSWNAYDSYGEVLLKNKQKEEAIKMYKKSIELNPKK